jgi:hypothetical protein
VRWTPLPDTWNLTTAFSISSPSSFLNLHSTSFPFAFYSLCRRYHKRLFIRLAKRVRPYCVLSPKNGLVGASLRSKPT